MESIYIGCVYSRGLSYNDGTSFENVPSVVLYNQSTKTSVSAQVTIREDGGCDFTISAANTLTMLPGVYSIEVYSGEDATDLIYRQADYAKAIRVSRSNDEQE